MAFLEPKELPGRVQAWSQSLGLELERRIALEAPALLILDMQNDFLSATGQLPVWGGPAAIPRIASLLEDFRRAGTLVVFTRHVCLEPFRHAGKLGVMDSVSDPGTFLGEGTIGAAIHPGVGPSTGEFVLTKHRYSAFYDTQLDSVLRIHGIRDVVISGVATSICCESTAHDAFFRGYNVCFLLDGTGGVDEASHLATLRTIQMAYGQVTVTGQVSKALDTLNKE